MAASMRLRMIPDVLKDVTGMRCRHADHLGHIERRAAPESDDAIGAMRGKGRSALHHLAAGRVAMDAIKHGDLQAIEMAAEFSQHGQCGQGAIGHDQRAAKAQGGQVAGHELARAWPELDGGWKRKILDAHGLR